MPLLSDDLSVWEIGFRWAGRDPDRWWWRIPLPVRDNFRMLMDAILNAHLECWNLRLEKWQPGTEAPRELFIRYHLQEVEDCIAGAGFDRKLLRWADIKRAAFQQWCERRAIQLPEFWFPPGWNIDYQWPEDEEEFEEQAAGVESSSSLAVPGSSPSGSGEEAPLPSGAQEVSLSPAEAESAPGQKPEPHEDEPKEKGLRPSQRAKIACQQIARAIWKREPNLTITAMAEREEILVLGGAANWQPEVVQRWLGEADERDPARKRGPRRRK